MKKIIKNSTLIFLVLAALFVFVGCQNGVHENNGLHFRLPGDMEEKSYEYAPIAYGKKGVNFMAHVYLKDIILSELGFSSDITAKEYSEEFIRLNGYTDYEYNYDEQTKIVTFSLVYEYDNEAIEDEFFFYYIVRTERALYIVIMDCKVSMMEEYKPIFELWASDIWVE